MFKPSKIYEDKINDVLSENNNNWLKGYINIGSYVDVDFNITPLIIETIEISQRYFLDTMNDIKIIAKFHITDLLKIVKNFNSLYVQLTLKFADPLTGDEDLSEKPIRRIYNLYIPNLDDLYKKFNINQLTLTDDSEIIDEYVGTLIPIALQLIEPLSFSVRKRQLNLILQQSSIKDAVLFIANNLGFKRINYVDKFVPSTIQNFHIPIEYGKYNIIFDYIHKRYGIYDRGFNYYFDNEVLYMYPHCDMGFNRKNESILHIYKIAQNSYDGMKNYHKFIDNDLYIVSNSNLINQKLSGLLLENSGTNRVFLDTKKLIDTSRSISGETVTINDNIINLSTDPTNKIAKDSITIDYSEPSLNLFYNSSQIAERNSEIIMLEWPMARPFLLIPGNRVKFYYEDENGVTIRDGLLENSEYHLTKIKQAYTTTEEYFSCKAKFQLRLNQE